MVPAGVEDGDVAGAEPQEIRRAAPLKTKAAMDFFINFSLFGLTIWDGATQNNRRGMDYKMQARMTRKYMKKLKRHGENQLKRNKIGGLVVIVIGT